MKVKDMQDRVAWAAGMMPAGPYRIAMDGRTLKDSKGDVVAVIEDAQVAAVFEELTAEFLFSVAAHIEGSDEPECACGRTLLCDYCDVD